MSTGSSSSEEDDGVASPYSKVAWSAILSPDEIPVMPSRDDPDYVPFYEKIIGELNEKVKNANASKRVLEVEDKISGLMTQLTLASTTKPQCRSCPLASSAPAPSPQAPSMPSFHQGNFSRSKEAQRSIWVIWDLKHIRNTSSMPV